MMILHSGACTNVALRGIRFVVVSMLSVHSWCRYCEYDMAPLIGALCNKQFLALESRHGDAPTHVVAWCRISETAVNAYAQQIASHSGMGIITSVCRFETRQT